MNQVVFKDGIYWVLQQKEACWVGPWRSFILKWIGIKALLRKQILML